MMTSYIFLMSINTIKPKKMFICACSQNSIYVIVYILFYRFIQNQPEGRGNLEWSEYLDTMNSFHASMVCP